MRPEAGRGDTVVGTKITVTVTEPLGIDDPDLMLAELQKVTGLPWQSRTVEKENVLSGGITALILTAVASGVVAKTTEMSTEAALNAVKGLVRRWRSEQLDPPEIAVSEESVPDSEATAPPVADGSDR
jgi:hypothetical protein